LLVSDRVSALAQLRLCSGHVIPPDAESHFSTATQVGCWP
jgi:hypothetical protein